MVHSIDLDRLALLDRRAIQDQRDRRAVLARLDRREIPVPPDLKVIQDRLGQQAQLVIRDRRASKVTLVLPDLSVLLDRKEM